jgi:hypothetical protein
MPQVPWPEGTRRIEGQSEFLRGQLREWLDQIDAAGRTQDLFELEMWLRSFERFFRVRNQPLSEKEAKQLALRNWSEELRLVDNVILRVAQLCTAILTEEQVNQTRFDQYVEGYLKKDDLIDPYIEKLMRQAAPEAGLTLLREAFEDAHLLLTDLVKLSRMRYATFAAVGRVLYREIRRSHLIALLIDKKFKPIHDRITNPTIAAIVRRIDDVIERKQAARVFLELFRLLHYLTYTDPSVLEESSLKNTILIFSLITSETRLLLNYIERRVLKTMPPERLLYQVYDSLVYCLPLELKKVINTELLDISVSRQADNIRARVENSHGILRDCFQQSIVQVAQAFEPSISGEDIFPDFTAKLDQSVRLRDGLASLIRAVRDFSEQKNESAAQNMRDEISLFYDESMKYLMYRDWTGFEIFFIEMLKCGSQTALLQIAHRFETFLTTLFREVMKRGILQQAPAGENAAALEAQLQ